MIITIPIGRIAQWVADMKHGYSPLEEGNVHAFLNHAGLTKEEAKKAGGANGDPWCIHCGRNYRKHPNIDYPVFVPPPEWEELPEVEIPIGALRPSGKPVRWPFEVVSDRGLHFYLYAVDENQAYQHASAFEFSHTRTPVFVRLCLPVPDSMSLCLECATPALVTTSGLPMWGQGIAGSLPSGYLAGLCGSCTVKSYIKTQSRPDCRECGGDGWTQGPQRDLGRPSECYVCQGSGVSAG